MTTTEKPNRKKGGRPKKSDALKRTHTLGFCVTDAQYSEIAARAKNAGFSVADYLRFVVLAGSRFAEESDDPIAPAVPAINLAWVGKLAHAAANLNQLAKAANSGLIQNGETVYTACRGLYIEVQELRAVLAGVKS